MALFWIGGYQQAPKVQGFGPQERLSRISRTATAQKVANGKVTPEADVHTDAVRGYEGEPQKQRRPIITTNQLMKQHLYCLGPDELTDTARRLFLNQKIHHVPIVDEDNQLLGIVSDRDLLRASNRELEEGQKTLGEIMTRRVLVAAPETPIREIAGTMAEASIHAIPVVDKQQKLLGLVTSTDILACLYNRAPLDMWL